MNVPVQSLLLSCGRLLLCIVFFFSLIVLYIRLFSRLICFIFFISDFFLNSEWVLPIVEDHTATYSCLHLRHLLSRGKQSHWLSYSISLFLYFNKECSIDVGVLQITFNIVKSFNISNVQDSGLSVISIF